MDCRRQRGARTMGLRGIPGELSRAPEVIAGPSWVTPFSTAIRLRERLALHYLGDSARDRNFVSGKRPNACSTLSWIWLVN